MPKKAVKKVGTKRRVKKSAQSGEGIMDIFKGINNLLKKTKIISTLAPLAGLIPGVGPIAGTVGGVAGSLGYGRKKKRAAPKKKGGSLGLPGRGKGGALKLAGKGTIMQVPQAKPYR